MKTIFCSLCLIITAATASAQTPVKPATSAPTFTIHADSSAAQKLWPQHRETLVNVLEKVRTLHATAKKYDDQGKDRETVTQLLAEPTRQVTAKELKGEWRVRSLQGSTIGDTYGVFIYPWFKARIVEKKDGLFFEKISGSQRRSGFLYPPDAASNAWLFAGGWSVNEDPQVPYSRTGGQAAPTDKDSTGLLLGLKGGRLLMLADVKDNDYEIYELKR